MTATSDRAWRGLVFIATSIDGHIAREDGDLDWLTSRGAEAGDTGYDALMAEVDTLLMGRGTYDKVLTFDTWPYEGKPVLVLSSTAQTDDPRVQVVRSLDEAVAVLGQRGSRAVYLDGGGTVTSFLAAGLVDRLTITQVPVVLGSGLRLFGALPADVALEHQQTRVLGGGLVQSTWTVLPAGAGPRQPGRRG